MFTQEVCGFLQQLCYLCNRSQPSLGVWQRFLCLLAWCGNWQILFMKQGRAKRLLHSVQIFSFPIPICFTNIYERHALWTLYCLCFECQQITSALYLPQIHQNIWSDSVFSSHYHALKRLEITIFNEMWWRAMLNLPY